MLTSRTECYCFSPGKVSYVNKCIVKAAVYVCDTPSVLLFLRFCLLCLCNLLLNLLNLFNLGSLFFLSLFFSSLGLFFSFLLGCVTQLFSPSRAITGPLIESFSSSDLLTRY